MRSTSEDNDRKVHSYGFILDEIMVVIAIMSILASVAVPSLFRKS